MHVCTYEDFLKLNKKRSLINTLYITGSTYVLLANYNHALKLSLKCFIVRQNSVLTKTSNCLFVQNQFYCFHYFRQPLTFKQSLIRIVYGWFWKTIIFPQESLLLMRLRAIKTFKWTTTLSRHKQLFFSHFSIGFKLL